MTVVEAGVRFTFDLPWPARGLHPNARLHWGAKSKLTKQARNDAAWAATAAGAKNLKADKLDVLVTFHEPDKRRRDTDGMLSSIKASLDGLADATGIDDHKFNLSIRRGDIVRGGLVRIEATPVVTS